MSTLRDRIGFDAGSRRLEDALAWAVQHGFHHVDFNADLPPNHLIDGWDGGRVRAIRETCAQHDIHLGLHTSSAVNVAELAPYAERRGSARLLLENLNREPEHAEVRYMAHTVAECRPYLDAIASSAFGWAYTVNHAHLVPEGVDGFLDAFGIERIGEVRLADSTGEYEIHLPPGRGTIGFGALFRRLEGAGYRHHYMMAFGTDADKLAARDVFAACGGSARP